MHKTILFVIVSTLFATDYGITTVSNARSLSLKEQIQASEFKSEEAEETQRLKLLLTELHSVRTISRPAPSNFHRTRRHD